MCWSHATNKLDTCCSPAARASTKDKPRLAIFPGWSLLASISDMATSLNRQEQEQDQEQEQKQEQVPGRVEEVF